MQDKVGDRLGMRRRTSFVVVDEGKVFTTLAGSDVPLTALGMEALERFVRKEPFHRVHECVFAVLALENEEIDPRL